MSQDKLKKCFFEGEKGGERHKGLRKITPDAGTSKQFLRKALHNFQAISDFHKMGYSDWSASAAFYALYHGLLAILAKKGYESRNQSCTFALVDDWISKKEVVELTHDDVEEIFDKDVTFDLENSNKILDIRERMQYSTKTSLAEEEFMLLNARTGELLAKIRRELEREDA